MTKLRHEKKMGRPRKSLEHHLMTGNYRVDRHGPKRAQPAPDGELALSAEQEAGLQMWGTYFTFGKDFFHEATRAFGWTTVGLDRTHDTDSLEKALRLKGRKAWGKLGEAFMATWTPEPDHPVPWAYVKFGPPSGGKQ